MSLPIIPRKAKRTRFAAFDKIRNVFALLYSQMIAQQLRELNANCRHLYFIKIGDELKCCVFISRGYKYDFYLRHILKYNIIIQ